MSDFQPIVSSNLESAAYEDGAIVVRFKNGSTYKYPSCTGELWAKFQKEFDGKGTHSAGKFLNAKLRPKPYERIDDWK